MTTLHRLLFLLLQTLALVVLALIAVPLFAVGLGMLAVEWVKEMKR